MKFKIKDFDIDLGKKWERYDYRETILKYTGVDILKTDESQFATIIRGYFLDINDELVKMNRALSLKKEYLANRPFDDFLLDYLNQSRANLRNKPRKPFVGGLKNKNFILPPINPNVEPVML